MSERSHELKTHAAYFEAVKRGWKTFEVRRDDRGFQKGDMVTLLNYLGPYYISPDGQQTSLPSHAEKLQFRIGWILTGGQFGIQPGYVAFSLEPIRPERDGGGDG